MEQNNTQVQRDENHPSWSNKAALLFIFSAMVSLIQYQAGSYGSELSHWPDASSHVVNSLLIHNYVKYVKSGAQENPMRFAERYYVHYPKVAIGMWPPLYYVVAAVWMLIFGVNKIALLLLVALTTGALATVIACLVWRFWNQAAGIVTGTIWVLLPQIIFGSTIFTLDIAVALAQFMAMLSMFNFLTTRSIRGGIWFGVWASVAMFTKGNGMALALFTPLAVALTRSWWALRNPGLYLSALVVLCTALPWQLFSLTLYQGTALVYRVDGAFVLGRTTGYLAILLRELGWPLLTLAIGGLFITLWRNFSGRTVPLLITFIASLGIASLVFHCVVPIPGPDERYMTTVYCCLILLAAYALQQCSQWPWITTWKPSRRAIVLSVIDLPPVLRTL